MVNTGSRTLDSILRSMSSRTRSTRRLVENASQRHSGSGGRPVSDAPIKVLIVVNGRKGRSWTKNKVLALCKQKEQISLFAFGCVAPALPVWKTSRRRFRGSDAPRL